MPDPYGVFFSLPSDKLYNITMMDEIIMFNGKLTISMDIVKSYFDITEGFHRFTPAKSSHEVPRARPKRRRQGAAFLRCEVVDAIEAWCGEA